jgi:hypothetical protein
MTDMAAEKAERMSSADTKLFSFTGARLALWVKDKVILISDHIRRNWALIALLVTMLMRGWNEVKPQTGS